MNPSTAQATVMVDELARGGVAHAVLAPGSRSTPLALALAAAADAGRMRLHVRIDERSASFLALGLAKVSGRPTAVVTTSGTAVANLLPAVIEAHLSGVPLVMLTADRPPELRDTGANQTIDQLKVFGDAVRMFSDVGVAENRPSQNVYWRGLVARALLEAQGAVSRQPGPVHLNLAFREPLVDDSSTDWLERLEGRDKGLPWTTAEELPSTRSSVRLPAKTVVVVGDCSTRDGQDALRLAEEQGWPVISEPSGNANRGPQAISTGGWLLGVPEWWERARPESIVVVGRPTLSRSVVAALRDERVQVCAVPSGGRWVDATRTAAQVLRSLPEADGHHEPDEGWLDLWQSGERRARLALDSALDANPSSEQFLTRELHASLPTDALVVAGSSLPIRHLFLCARPREGVTTVANRGASGIDGTTSTAVGAAIAWQETGGGPAIALMGDVTFLHDSNGLLGDGSPPPDLTIVVINNNGGGIFELLEQADSPDRASFERVFATPHGADLAALCGASQTPFTRVSNAGELVQVVSDPRGGLQVVEARTHRSQTASLHRALADAVSSAVRSS